MLAIAFTLLLTPPLMAVLYRLILHVPAKVRLRHTERNFK